MAFRLPPRALEAGHRLLAFETIGSTNAEALARGRAGEAGPLWVVSDHQTAGRGRRGNAWQTPCGNLAASLLLRTGAGPAAAATFGFVGGLAVRSALERAAPGPSFRLKWPNDVLADNAKLAGILLETEVVGGTRIVALGIGVNVAASPAGLPYRSTSLAGLGLGVTAEELFDALSEAWIGFHSLWNEGRGMAQIRSLWLDCAAGIGEPIAVRLGAEIVRGVFQTIDPAGQLILRSKDGATRAIAAGEVHFGAAATAREFA
jgi:BirA family biotin operon repressor/biotin-[acetyl-CoA-carboxylase] ligase